MTRSGLILMMAAMLCGPVLAQQMHFLQETYIKDGKMHCKYSNGTILVVMASCPVSIKE